MFPSLTESPGGRKGLSLGMSTPEPSRNTDFGAAPSMSHLFISLASIQNLPRLYPILGLVPGPGGIAMDKIGTVPAFRDSRAPEKGSKSTISYDCVQFW